MIGIVGAKGFIGSNLMRMLPSSVAIFPPTATKTEIDSLSALYIAAPTSSKYLVQNNPLEDRENVLELSKSLIEFSRIKNVVLFSTIDVYQNRVACDEDSSTMHDISYGGNRMILEDRLNLIFSDLRIVRLCGVYGPGLKKNLIFDIKNHRPSEVAKYAPESSYQLIHIGEVYKFITGERADFPNLINLVTEPISVSEILSDTDLIARGRDVVRYNVKSKYFEGGYAYSKQHSLNSIKDFLND